MKCKIILFFLLFLLVNNKGWAQPETTGYLGIEQGLSNNSVTCIHRDRQGFMWFGTYDGLNRFDGYAFKTFRNRLNDTTSLINNRIVAIGEDSVGNMWVATKSGLNRYNSREDRFYPVYYQPYGSMAQQPAVVEIYSIGTDRAGNVFVGTSDRGLLIYPAGGKVARQVPLQDQRTTATYPVSALDFDNAGHCWLFIPGTGLCRYDDSTQRIQLVNSQQQSANCLATDGDDNCWLGNDEGVYRYNKTAGTWKRYNDTADMRNSKVISLTVDHAQQLWIATDGDGIHILPLRYGNAVHLQAGQDKHTLSSNAVYAVYEDKDQRKWIGTLRGGINIIDKHKTRFRTIAHDALTSNSLVNNFTFSFCEDNNDIWIGTDGGGISLWNRRQNTYMHFMHGNNQAGSLSNNNITSVVKDADNNIWIATFGGGINRYERNSRSFRHYTCSVNGYENRFVWKLYRDAAGELWAGACMGGSLYRYNKAADRFEAFDSELRDIITIAEDRSGALWLGTFNRLIRLDKKTHEKKYYHVGHNVRAIYEDKTNHFWIGTEGGGLLSFDRSAGTFTRLTDKDGLPNNAVLNIEEDRLGNLWMSTYNGIARYSPTERRCKNFYESDGLQSNQFNYNASLRLSSGELLFGGIKGFNIFNPDSITESRDFPALLVAGLRISNTPASYTDHLTLSYDKAFFSLDYVALEYSSPDKISYAYFLEGWDNEWNYVNNLRTANYSRLKEGNYTLRIKSTNADGVWNPQERITVITVLPPWYRTWWAYSIYLLLVAGMLYCYRLYQQRQARLKYEIELSHLQAEKEKELHERKLSFFTNISHEFRTPLTLIINPVKELLYSDGRNIESKDLTIVYRNARRLLSLVDQLLLFRKADREEDLLKIVKLNITALCKEVFLCFTHQAELKKMQFEFVCRQEQADIYADREKIEVALFNLLSNAFKYTPDGGQIIFSVQETEEEMIISIKDSGCGIPADVGNKLFDRFYQVFARETSLKNGFGIGLYLVKKFIGAHKGGVAYNSEPAAGTTFTVTLLKGTAHLEGHVILEEAAENNTLLEELVEDDDLEQAAMQAEEAATEDTLDVLLSPQPSMLVVDDNEQMRSYIKSIFRSSFTIYEAAEGQEGFGLAAKHLPDIIISDVLMDGLSGIELCRQIKLDPSLGHIPVVLLTASSSSEIKLKGIEGGADDYMSKPFDKELFVARITNIIRSRNTLQQYFYNEITLNTGNQKISAEYKDFLNRCIAITERHLDDADFNIKVFAREIGISHSTLYKKVKSISGRSVSEFIRFIRLRKAAELLINTGCNVNEAAFRVGFNDVKYFREQFCKLFEMNPSEYIKKYRKKFDKTI